MAFTIPMWLRPLAYLSWGYEYTLPITTICLFIFYFTRKYKPFYVATALLLLINSYFIMTIPIYFQNFFSFDWFRYFGAIWGRLMYFFIGVWALVRALRDLTIILKGESVVDQWNMIIEQAAGKGKELLDATEKFIKEARIPNTACFQDYVSTSLFGQKRQFLLFYNLIHQDYKMYISARNIGTHLDVSWFATIEPRLLKRTLSKYMMGDPQALSQQVDMFDQQDLRACFTVAHHCLQQAIDILLEELKQQPLGVRGSPQSKGFLSVW